MPEEKVAKVIGKILTSPKFRADLEKNPEKALKSTGVTIDAATKSKLTRLNKEVLAGKVSTEAPLHCEVASSVGYA